MMKKLFFLIVYPLALTVWAQAEYGGFKVENQQIVYQKVFTSDSVTIKKLGEFYNKVEGVSHVVMTNTGVDFDLNDLMVDYQKFKFSQVNTPMIIQSGKFSGKVSVGVRDGRYRIKISDFTLTGNIVYKTIPEKEPLTGYATVNSATQLHRDWCRPNMLGLLEQAISDRLQYVEKDGGDW